MRLTIDLVASLSQSVARGLQGSKRTLREFFFKFLDHYLTHKINILHDDLIDHLGEIAIRRNVRSAVAAPRGSAKSTIISLGNVLWLICEGLEKYIILGADSSAQATLLLSHVKQELEHNADLAEEYPDVCGKGSTWTTERIITRNNICIDAVGAGKKIRGRRFGRFRPTCIIIDDPENDEGARSPIVRERVRTWLDAGVAKAGGPGTNIVVNGTVINGGCLIYALMERPGWEHRLYKSIMSWPERMDLWEAWEKLFFDDPEAARLFYELHEQEMNRGAKVLWEDREPLYDLMCMRAEGGHAAFMSEKQNDPINPAQCRFDELWFTDAYNIWYDSKPIGGFWFLSVDPSTGNDAKKGDYIAMLECYWKPGERYVYVDGVIDRFPATEIIDKAIEWHKKRRYVFCAFEANAFQVVLAGDLAVKSAEAGVQLPVLPVYHNTNKMTRIERLGGPLSKGIFKFNSHSPHMRRLVKQLQQFGAADHDDGPDALEMAMTCMHEWITRYKVDEEEVTVLGVV